MKPQSAPSETVRHSRIIKASPIYYGWVILLAASIGMLMTTPGQTVSVGVFLDSIIADLGLKRTTVSLMYTFATLTGSLALPFVGRFIDRRGPRLSVIIIASLFTLACVFMGLINGLISLFIGFVLIRSLGQGALSLVSVHVINIWFVRRRGLAVGLSGIGFATGTALFPRLIESLSQTFDWRITYMLLGLLVAISILPLGALLFRGHPELYGLEPDGSAQTKPLNEENFTPAEARATLTFWLYVTASFCVSALGTALLFHNYDIFAEQGLSRELATQVFIPLGFILLLSNIFTGYLLDRVPPRFVLSAAQGLLGFVLIMSTQLSTQNYLFYGISMGLTLGMMGTLGNIVYAYYFGRKHIGAIKGQVTTIGVAASALGPLILSSGKDLFGSYELIIFIVASIPFVIALIAPFIRPPKKQTPLTVS